MFGGNPFGGPYFGQGHMAVLAPPVLIAPDLVEATVIFARMFDATATYARAPECQTTFARVIEPAVER